MIKYIALFALTLIACSDNEESFENCKCETITFQPNIDLSQGIYITTDCLSWYEREGPVNVTIDRTTSPVTVYGPSEKQVTLSKEKNGRCQ